MRVLIVGADGGIGRALLNAIPNSVGTSRREGSELIRLDVTDDATYPVFEEKFDEIYYCVGVGGKQCSVENTIYINAIKSLDCLRHLAQFVKDDGSIRIMSSVTGSVAFSTRMNLKQVNLGYKMSKASLNIGVIRLSHEFQNIRWQLLHPGFVKTKMTEGIITNDPQFVLISPEESASWILKTPVEGRISFMNCISGHIIPW